MPPPLILLTLPLPLNAQPRPIEAPSPLVHWCLSSRLPLVCRLVVALPLSRASASHHILLGSRRTHPSSTPHLCSRQLVVTSHLFALPPPLNALVPLSALLNAWLQCGRLRVGRRRRRPSNNNALPPAPHRCTTTAAAPTTLHSHSPAKGAITNIPRTPHHRRFTRRKALEGVRRPPPPSFDVPPCSLPSLPT
jgi:hypothetical protein